MQMCPVGAFAGPGGPFARSGGTFRLATGSGSGKPVHLSIVLGTEDWPFRMVNHEVTDG